MNSQEKEKKSKDKEKVFKRATIAWNDATLQAWQETMKQLNLYETNLVGLQSEEDVPGDPLKEKQKTKFLINEATLIDYVLTTLELMAQCKEYSEDSFVIALRNVGELQRKKIKVMLTSFIESYRKAVPFSNELSYYTIMLQPEQLPRKTPQLLAFYLKLRKYIFANFINDRDQSIKPLTFDQWVSVVSKFMDNSAISAIGNRIKEHVAPKKSSDKIIKNNVHPFDLLVFCYELQQERTEPPEPKPRQIATFSPTQQEEYISQRSKPTAQQLAYKMMIGNQKSPNGQKLEITDELRRKKLKQVVEIHEDLAYNYKILANYIIDAKEIIKKHIQKVMVIMNEEAQSSQQGGELDVSDLEVLTKFNQFLQIDPEINLANTGVHEYL